MKDIVVYEADYGILTNRVDTYIAFLSKSITEYQKILDFMMEEAIQDNEIRAKLLNLKSDVALYTQNLEAIRSETKTLIANACEEFEKADKANLPVIDISEILANLTAFFSD